MVSKMTNEDITFSFILLLGLVDAPSALGAAFGSTFFLTTRDETLSTVSGLMLTTVSLGLGYSLGIAVGSDHRMWVSLVGAALGSTILSSLHGVIKSGGDLPSWLKYTIDTILRLRK